MRPRQRQKDQKKKQQSNTDSFTYEHLIELEQLKVSPSLEENEKTLKQLFSECSDVVMRKFQIKHMGQALVLFVAGFIDNDILNETLDALMNLEENAATDIEKFKEYVLPVSQVQIFSTYDQILLAVLSGDAAILIDGEEKAALIGISDVNLRSVSEPETETVVRGPREGFIESIHTNITMLRRRLKTPHLKMTSLISGKQTNTSVIVSYMENIADSDTVQEVLDRIRRIDVGSILESGTIEQLIEDSVYSPFPQIQYTERPDTVVASLLEGRIAILVDGTPFALLVPTTFWMLMQASEDYYERMPISTMIRWIRYIFLLVSLVTPALYVAVITFHSDFLPTALLLSIAASREAIPFPAAIEAILMEVIFEALREAGIRLPKAIGQTVSILGALVVGSAAVEAGIVSAPVVIVVSITGIASFTIPRFNGAIAMRMLRFPLIFAAATFGLFGISLLLFAILGHMVSLRSVGVPYMAPAAPLSWQGMKDVLIRSFIHRLEHRPSFLAVRNSQKIDPDFSKMIQAQHGQKGKSTEHEASGQNESKEE